MNAQIPHPQPRNHLLFHVRKNTISTEMAAGVIPSMRLTWPNEAGRTAASFSLISLESP